MRLRRGRDFAERELVAFVAGSAGHFAACAMSRAQRAQLARLRGRNSVKVAEKPTGVDRDARMRRLIHGWANTSRSAANPVSGSRWVGHMRAFFAVSQRSASIAATRRFR
jgi:hypothetical protein